MQIRAFTAILGECDTDRIVSGGIHPAFLPVLQELSGRCPADRIVCICGAVDDFYRENGDSGNECGA